MAGIFRDDYIVMRLVELATPSGGIEGKKALQKMLYFFNLRHRRFIYKWAPYGPYSQDVQQAVHEFTYTKEIEVENVPTRKEGIHVQRLKYAGRPPPRYTPAELLDFPEDLDEGLRSVLDFADTIEREERPRKLELLASVHFIARSHERLDAGYTAVSVHDHLHALKPAAGFKLSDVEESIDTLKAAGYL